VGTGGFIDLTDTTDWYFTAIGKERAQRGEEGHGVWGSEERTKKPCAPRNTSIAA
jgi:hypothetical protein